MSGAELQRYRNHSPTQFDNNIALRDGYEEQNEWLIAPCSQTRDSDALARSNFIEQLAQLKDEANSDDYEVHRFGHWGPGWYEIVLVRPGSKAEKVALEIAGALEQYPVLNDEAFSELELEGAEEAWESWGRYDLGRDLGKNTQLLKSSAAIEFVHDHMTFDEALNIFDGEIYEGCAHFNVTHTTPRRVLLARWFKSQRKGEQS